MFKAFVFAAAGLTTLAAVPFIRRIWHDEYARFLIGTMLVFLILPFVKTEFGQREHFAGDLDRAVHPGELRLSIGRPAGAWFDATRAPWPAGLRDEAAPPGGARRVRGGARRVRRSPRVWLRPAAVGAAAAVALYGAGGRPAGARLPLSGPGCDAGLRRPELVGGVTSCAWPIRTLWVVGLLLLLALRFASGAARGRAAPPVRGRRRFQTAVILGGSLRGGTRSSRFIPRACGSRSVLRGDGLRALPRPPGSVLARHRGGKSLHQCERCSGRLVDDWSAWLRRRASKPIATEPRHIARRRDLRPAPTRSCDCSGIQGHSSTPRAPTTNIRDALGARHESLWFLPGLYEDEHAGCPTCHGHVPPRSTRCRRPTRRSTPTETGD